jgi:AraC family ethanolamine operon transcriptional activator
MKKTPHDDAPDLCVHPTKDANQQAASLVNWQQEYDQLSGGCFSGQIRERRFKNIHVFREDSNRILKQHCRVDEGGVWIGLSADDQLAHLNHQRADAEQVLIQTGGQDFELLTPEAFSIYGLVFHNSENNAYLNTQRPNTKCISQGFKSLPTREIEHLKTYLRILLSNKPTKWSCKTHEVILTDLLLALVDCNTSSMEIAINPSHRQKIMTRVLEQVEAMDPSCPITIGELSQSVHVSRRTLQYVFEAYCDLSPKQFLLNIRLNQVRRMLQNSELDKTISEIAFAFGFFHLSQFSRLYKNLFGESPSETRQIFRGKYIV